jgi:hypothetical protein
MPVFDYQRGKRSRTLCVLERITFYVIERDHGIASCVFKVEGGGVGAQLGIKRLKLALGVSVHRASAWRD